MSRLSLLILALLLGGCAADASGGGGALDAAAEEPRLPGTGWRSAPADGVDLAPTDSSLTVVVGPHAVVWPAAARPLAPPYAVSATFHKRRGRIHEGYGLVVGGDPLDAPETAQAYSYFLIRGDGSFLIRRREGEAIPILRGWTTDPAILRDTEEGGRPNTLRVEVDELETVFRVNGSEVARLPTSELRVHGLPGFRVAHDVQLEVSGFTVDTMPRGEG